MGLKVGGTAMATATVTRRGSMGLEVGGKATTTKTVSNGIAISGNLGGSNAVWIRDVRDWTDYDAMGNGFGDFVLFRWNRLQFLRIVRIHSLPLLCPFSSQSSSLMFLYLLGNFVTTSCGGLGLQARRKQIKPF